MIQYLAGEDSVLWQLVTKNRGLICMFALELMKKYNCLHRTGKNKLSPYSYNIKKDLESTGNLALATLIQKKKYDPSCGKFSTYYRDHVQGEMRRYLETNIGTISVKKDVMTRIRKMQVLYNTGSPEDSDMLLNVAESEGVSEKQLADDLKYNTHFLSVYDLVTDENQDPFEVLLQDKVYSPVHKTVLNKLKVEFLKEIFDALPLKDREILGAIFGAYGHKREAVEDIAIRFSMKEDGVQKARQAAIKLIRDKLPHSRLQALLWANKAVKRAQDGE